MEKIKNITQGQWGFQKTKINLGGVCINIFKNLHTSPLISQDKNLKG